MINLTVIGLGNCASSVIEGLLFYSKKQTVAGLMYAVIGGYHVNDIKIVSAIDVDARKIGKDIADILNGNITPICTERKMHIPKIGVTVKKGPEFDGVASYMKAKTPKDLERFFVDDTQEPVDIVAEFKNSGTEIVINFLPTGSNEATRYYMQCALDAECSFINCIPSSMSKSETNEWIKKFEKKGLILLGNDIQSGIGATVVNKLIAWLIKIRGGTIKQITQNNFLGNTDALNLTGSTLQENRIAAKEESKVSAVVSEIPTKDQDDAKINMTIAYKREYRDHKHCLMEIEGRQFMDDPFFINLQLKVQDSPNAAMCLLDLVRHVRAILDLKKNGTIIPEKVLTAILSFYFKSPISKTRMSEYQSFEIINKFIDDKIDAILVCHSRIGIDKKGQSSSDFWSTIAMGFIATCNINEARFEVLSPKKHYYDEDEFCNLLKRAVNLKPSVLVLPATFENQSKDGKFREILKNFPNKIVFVNVEPNDALLQILGNKVLGFVGVNEEQMGKIGARWLLSNGKKVKRIIAIRHLGPQHSGHNKRTKGIQIARKQSGEENEFLEVNLDIKDINKRSIAKLLTRRTGFFTYGNKVTEALLKALKELKKKSKIVGTDFSKITKEAMENEAICGYLDQHPFDQGAISALLALGKINRPIQSSIDMIEKTDQ